jgi:hypothetical protein
MLKNREGKFYYTQEEVINIVINIEKGPLLGSLFKCDVCYKTHPDENEAGYCCYEESQEQ